MLTLQVKAFARDAAFLVLCVPLASCTALNAVSNTQQPTAPTNPRVDERSLVVPQRDDQAPVVPTRGHDITQQSALGAGTIAREYFIAFDDESWVLPATGMVEVNAALSESADQRVVIIGNSHGYSRVGTGRLARKRADAVYHYFVANGIDARRIHRLASWDNTGVDHAPARGVQVHIVSMADPRELIIKLAKM